MPEPGVPTGYNTVSPYLTVGDVAGSIRFMIEVFDGWEVEKIVRPDGSIGHAEVRIGSSLIMLGGNSQNVPARPAALYLYVADVDETYARALAAGATSQLQPADMFYGDRVSAVVDPNGTLWWIATSRERLSPEEIQARANKQMK